MYTQKEINKVLKVYDKLRSQRRILVVIRYMAYCDHNSGEVNK